MSLHRRNLAGNWAGLMALVLLSCTFGNAQTTGMGTISGTVTDVSQAVIIGAKVTITNVATGVVRDAVANESGYYEVTALIPGSYTVSASYNGFRDAIRKGITLDANAHLSVPIQLAPGMASEQITVVGDAPLLNTESGTQGEVLTTKQLESLPVTGHNPIWLTTLAPGVATTTGQTSSTDDTLGWNGVTRAVTLYGLSGRVESSLDGAVNMQNRDNATNPNEEEMGEMNMDTTGFDASVGHSIGATVTMSTKSGTNVLHGTLRETYTNKRWAAMNHFQGDNERYQLAKAGCSSSNHSSLCDGIRNQYGFPGVHANNIGMALGGPIYIPKLIDGRNKLFFFQSIGIDDFSGVYPSSIHIPTVQERNGDFSDLIDPAHPAAPAGFVSACPGSAYYGRYQIYNPYSVQVVNGVPRRTPLCGNVIPSNLMANQQWASLYNKLLPTPTSNDPIANNYTYAYTAPQTYHDFTTRVDYVPSTNNVIFIRYTHTRYTKMSNGWTVGNVDQQSGPRWVDVPAIGWTHVISPTTNFDLNIGGSSFRTHCCYYLGFDQYKPSSVGLPSYLDTYAATGATTALPIASISSAATLGNTDNSEQDFTNGTVRANLAHVRGKHSFRAGFEFRLQHNSQGAQGNTAGTYSFTNTYTQQNNGTDATYTQDSLGLSYAAFLMGVPTTSSVAYTSEYALSSPYYGLFVSDTWHPTRKLTIIPGVRFEYENGITEAQNRQLVGWDPNASLPIASAANAAYQTLYNGLPADQKAAMPASLTIQGGPLYAGLNGAGARETDNSLRILPRLAVAYQITHSTVLRVGYGRFFDTLNASVPQLVQPGYSASTSVASSSDYGQNFSLGNPPLKDPFPSANGTRFNTPIGNTLGTAYYLGGGSATVWDHVSPPSQNRVSISLQRQIDRATMVEAVVVGAWTKHLILGQTQTAMPASLYLNSASLQPNAVEAKLLSTMVTNPFNIGNFAATQATNPALYALMAKNSFFTAATQPLSALVRPYPWMSGLTLQRSIGETTFHQLQLNATRRLSHGFSVIASFQRNDQHDRDWFRNSFDTSPSWEGSNASRPYRFTAQTVWELPFGRGRYFAKSGILSALFGGFQLSTTYELQPGAMLGFGNLFYIGDPNNMLLPKPIYSNNLAGGGSDSVQWLTAGNVVATPVLNSQGVVTSCSYTGTGLVTNLNCQPNYNYNNFPSRFNGIRAMTWSGANSNLQRSFRFSERASFQVRVDAYNVFNHQTIGSPSVSPTDVNFGKITGDNTTASNGRWLSFMGRIQF